MFGIESCSFWTSVLPKLISKSETFFSKLPHSRPMAKSLRNSNILACNNETIHPTINSLWIGLADHRLNAKFEWLDNRYKFHVWFCSKYHKLVLSELVFSNWAAGEPKSNQDRAGRITRMMDLLLNSQSNSFSQSMSPSMSKFIYFDGAGKVEECVSMSRREQDKVDEISLEYDRSLSHNSNSNILTKIHLKITDPSKTSEK